ncbi:5258_t:CDS:2 [Ambispora leptoticha]|uniref:5258_t:CDS:1 n=1 Tax=Ambispora leptoticha TaxID=144679 RepID=A0A9N9C7Y4_9GLOM|nr:5258_t:CDS:2 [Ambispora leptoticha]
MHVCASKHVKPPVCPLSSPEIHRSLHTTPKKFSKLPERKIWNIEGELTDTLWWHGDSNKEDIDNNHHEKIVFFMICGNPGLIDYYIPFLTTIYDEFRRGDIVIVGVSHLGHSHTLLNSNIDPKFYTLQDQIEHKIKCFDKLREMFSTRKFILCGHSIGAYICSEVLRARSSHGIEKVYALFPTIQKISQTPNGRMLQFLFYERSRNLAGPFVQLFRSLFTPENFKYLIGFITWQSEPALSVTADKLLYGNIVKNALYMAETEMQEVQELDEQFYREHLPKYVFYFGKSDMWVPLDHYRDLLKRFPEGNVFLCEDGMPHAFVIGHSEKMGSKVAKWIKTLSI